MQICGARSAHKRGEHLLYLVASLVRSAWHCKVHSGRRCTLTPSSQRLKSRACGCPRPAMTCIWRKYALPKPLMTCATSQGWGGASCAVVDRDCTKLMSVPSPSPARMVSLYASTHSTALNGATTVDAWKAWTPPADGVESVVLDIVLCTLLCTQLYMMITTLHLCIMMLRHQTSMQRPALLAGKTAYPMC